MFERTDSVLLYFTYAALMTALIVCSVLSPIQVRSVGERKLCAYGVAIVYDLPPSTWPVASDSPSEMSSNSSQPFEIARVSLSLAQLPSSALTRCMTAYLFFAALCLLTCVSLIISLVVQVLPMKHDRAVIVVTRVFTVLVPLAAVLCFAMAAVLGLQAGLYHHVAAGYYSDTGSDNLVSKLRSGFFSSVAAAILGVSVALLSPVLSKW
ncbi:hypothetical protein MNV84_07471 [Leishmania braziliensis]|nr:hypothetical protein MNV84_07471 [Leishmania braziliensis]